MLDRYRRRLLGTTLPVVASSGYEFCNATSTTQVPAPEDVTATLEALGPKPRWAGGTMPGIPVEIASAMPPGWFGLREPGARRFYAGPLPLSSFGIFYRGGDVVCLSAQDFARLTDDLGASRC